jgi:hypothetical protein
MADPLYSFVYDAQAAAQAFPGRAGRDLVLALLAGMRVKPDWEGCAVFEGESPLEEPGVCIATRGPGADQVQQGLIEALERQGIGVLQVYEGGPEQRELYATVRGGIWS